MTDLKPNITIFFLKYKGTKYINQNIKIITLIKIRSLCYNRRIAHIRIQKKENKLWKNTLGKQ